MRGVRNYRNKKPKILRVITRMEKGGVPYEVAFISSCEEIKREFDTVLATGYCQNEVEIPSDVKVRRIKHLVRDVSPINDILALFEILKVIFEEKPDIIHAHTSKAGFLARLAGAIAGVPHIVYSPHGHIFHGYFSKPLTIFFAFLEFIASKFTDVIAVRTEDEEYAFRNIGCNTRYFKIPKAIIPLSSGTGKEKSEKKIRGNKDKMRKVLGEILHIKKAGNFVIGTVSRLEPVKGVEYLVRAFPMIKRKVPSVFLLVCGDGGEREKLEKMAKELIPDGSYMFTGWIESPDMLYPLFDVFVVPSINEAWGITIVEAGKNKVPVVASAVGGIPYFAGGYVKLVPPANEKKIAEAVLEVLLQPEKKKKLAEKSFELYLKYKPELMVSRYLELYRNLMREEGGKKRFMSIFRPI